MKRFESLSIALLDQIESNVCVSEHTDEDVDKKDEDNDAAADDDDDYDDDDDDDNAKVPDMTGEDC